LDAVAPASEEKSFSGSGTGATSSSSSMPVLTVDALTRSLRSEAPLAPPSFSPRAAPEPSLAQLTAEIACYRRDLRLLRKDMHAAGRGERPSSSPMGTGAVVPAGAVLRAIRPFTPGSSALYETARPEVAAMRAAREAALARRTERSMRGSNAPALQKMLRLRRAQEGPLAALSSRAQRGDVLLGDDELLALAAGGGGGGGSGAGPGLLLASSAAGVLPGVQTARTAEEEQQVAAKRFWRQGVKPQPRRHVLVAGLPLPLAAATKKKQESSEEKSSALPLIDSYIHATSRPVSSSPSPFPSSSVAALGNDTGASAVIPSFAMMPAAPPSGSGSARGGGSRNALQPRLSDVLEKLAQPPPVDLLGQQAVALSARTAVPKPLTVGVLHA